MTSVTVPFHSSESRFPPGIQILGPVRAEYREILTPSALRFVAVLERKFRAERSALLERRRRILADFDAGKRPDFSVATRDIREAEWLVAPPAPDLVDWRVEIVGPPSRRVTVDAMNSVANVFTADLEDSITSTWENVIESQINLRNAVRREIEFFDPERGMRGLSERAATLVVRPRAWHREETHVRVDGRAVSAAIFDFALYLFRNVRILTQGGRAPYFCLAKLEGHREARLWSEIFEFAERRLSLPRGTIRAAVRIETFPAAFEMDEILYELRDHAAGLGFHLGNYLASLIKTFRGAGGFVLPDPASVTLESHFVRACTRLLVQTSHRRGTHAIAGAVTPKLPWAGPVSAPSGGVRLGLEALREICEGHDGVRVDHPDHVSVVREAIARGLTSPHQLDTLREDVWVTARDLCEMPEGRVTEAGLRRTVRTGIRYLEAWLSGQGSVVLDDVHEDAGTGELARALVWQWIHHSAALETGQRVGRFLVHRIVDEQMARVREEIGDDRFHDGHFAVAMEAFEELVTAPELRDSLGYRAPGSLGCERAIG